MKSNIVTLIATIAIPLTARAAPEPNSDKTSIEQKNPNGIEIPGNPREIPDKENLPEKIATNFYKLSITDAGEAAAILKEHFHEKNFQAVPDHKTSRMFLMGSEGDIKRAIEMLNKMEREQDGVVDSDKAKHPEIIINILRDGSIRVEGQELRDKELSERIGAVLKQFPNQPIRIRADGEVKYQEVVKVIDLCQRAGAWNLSFATGKTKDEQAAPSNR